MDIHVQEVFRTTNRHVEKRVSPHNIKVKISKIQNQERMLKASSKKCQLVTKANFSERQETSQQKP
jgi:hypothetical protein